MHRIALLLCGNLSGAALEQNGGYTDIYARYLAATVPPAVEYAVDAFDVVSDLAYPNEDQYSSMILTGSAANAYDDAEWIITLVAFIQRIASTKPHIKLIGICFGHQIIARALGGSCVPNGGRWECGPTPVQLTDLGKQLFGAPDTLTIQQMHRDHVPTLPPSFHLLASSELSPVQGMIRFSPASAPPTSSSPENTPLRKIHILTTQFHPEFTTPITTAIVAQRVAAGAIPVPTALDFDRRTALDTQPDAKERVGKAVWGVITGEI
ncbi:hypothetical protein GALMADRAFT_76521 [Galerina marginata CBS 339.88]|uniref:Glutamine amidotransferase domain-containing protein n=1 Tax=Galerina marginata (strain CBS 339.88) TaxID=685588 RepID=A0A067SJP7_GALM3|nr:hypothetical protein GALMADRAFT_76521 [Galerina marginata CBS 339.88]